MRILTKGISNGYRETTMGMERWGLLGEILRKQNGQDVKPSEEGQGRRNQQ
jgi:hypothetical protein